MGRFFFSLLLRTASRNGKLQIFFIENCLQNLEDFFIIVNCIEKLEQNLEDFVLLTAAFRIEILLIRIAFRIGKVFFLLRTTSRNSQIFIESGNCFTIF